MQQDVYAMKLKENIKRMIENNQLNDAKNLIEHYKRIAPEDIESYSIMGVILILEEYWEGAEEILLNGLKIDNNNFDLLYNLAYLYELLGKYDKAWEFYQRAYDNCFDNQLQSQIMMKIEQLADFCSLEAKYKINRKKLVFFLKGNDQFIDNIIEDFSKEYQTKK